MSFRYSPVSMVVRLGLQRLELTWLTGKYLPTFASESRAGVRVLLSRGTGTVVEVVSCWMIWNRFASFDGANLVS